MNYFGYMRISTKEERDMQKYNRQEKALERYAKENSIEYVLILKEDKSGKSFDGRTAWKKIENLAQKGDVIVFKDISRFSREALTGYTKYMELLNKGIELIFLDNMTVSTPYIKQMLNIAKDQNLVTQVNLENTVKLLLIVELDRAEQERLILIERIKAGIDASDKKQGRKKGQLDKLTDELKEDIKLYNNDRSITQTELMEKHNISRNTLKKYAALLKDSDN